jgi:hypothetical protein
MWMKWVLVSLALAFITQIWLCLRVGRSSVALALFTFFLGPIGAVYTLFKHRGDSETSVTVPFVANLVFIALFLVTAWQVVLPALEADAREFDRVADVLPAGTAPATKPEAATLVASAPVAGGASTASAVMAMASEAASSAASDPVEAFSQALRSGGLQHTVTRLPASTPLPAGVAEAVLFAVSPLGQAPSASAASAPGGAELAVTLFKCESAPACRNLAGVHLQQAGPDKRRVLQNGLLLLSTPPASANDNDLTPTAVTSAFRKLQF